MHTCYVSFRVWFDEKFGRNISRMKYHVSLSTHHMYHIYCCLTILLIVSYLILVAAKAARDAFEAAQRKLARTEKKIADLKKEMEHDYGTDGEFSSFVGQCYSIQVKQYTYEMCPYEEAKQKEGHSGTSLGRWKGIENDGGKIAFVFEGGQSCWQGPQRSLKVITACGNENKVLSVEEPSKCVYEMKFTTPAVCNIQHAQVLKMNLEAGGSDEEEE